MAGRSFRGVLIAVALAVSVNALATAGNEAGSFAHSVGTRQGQQITGLPLDNGRFWVDPSVSAVSLILDRSSGVPAAVRSPDGRYHDADSHGAGFVWRTTAESDEIVVTDPMPGRWRVFGDVDATDRVLASSDIQLGITALPGIVPIGTVPEICFRLQEQGHWVTDMRRLSEFEVRLFLEGPDGTVMSMPVAAENGTYRAVLDNLESEGAYRMSIVMYARHFTRELRRSFV